MLHLDSLETDLLFCDLFPSGSIRGNWCFVRSSLALKAMDAVVNRVLTVYEALISTQEHFFANALDHRTLLFWL